MRNDLNIINLESLLWIFIDFLGIILSTMLYSFRFLREFFDLVRS